jgi:hypothetical protein
MRMIPGLPFAAFGELSDSNRGGAPAAGATWSPPMPGGRPPVTGWTSFCRIAASISPAVRLPVDGKECHASPSH